MQINNLGSSCKESIAHHCTLSLQRLNCEDFPFKNLQNSPLKVQQGSGAALNVSGRFLNGPLLFTERETEVNGKPLHVSYHVPEHNEPFHCCELLGPHGCHIYPPSSFLIPSFCSLGVSLQLCPSPQIAPSSVGSAGTKLPFHCWSKSFIIFMLLPLCIYLSPCELQTIQCINGALL